ncbi:MAG: transcriptional regulator [Solidesulfovibrio magneticus str. Maddingley MBC34]|uniref:Transcriptional regulator n=1 Tax=Solidesulfovibrio magneticus str. Maddingley MBC34 TaxID=1206767 RepID=K6FLQ6_9BACT|nr:MAG: transcriptional regulator [Solidesulfovibrio magneticus str. Maddingley MBC34]
MRNPSSKRQAAAQETRKGILEAAKAVYGGAQGAEAPVSHVAKLAGVAVGTVFVHFPDKPSLLAAALEEEIGAALAEAWETLPASIPCREQLLHLAGAMYRFYAGRPALYRVLLKETLFLRGEWGRRAVEDVLRFVEGVTALLEASRDRGEYRADADCRAAGRAFFGLYFLELLAAFGEESFDAEQALGRLRPAVLLMEQGLVQRG